jgi:hypothetical protein
MSIMMPRLLLRRNRKPASGRSLEAYLVGTKRTKEDHRRHSISYSQRELLFNPLGKQTMTTLESRSVRMSKRPPSLEVEGERTPNGKLKSTTPT